MATEPEPLELVPLARMTIELRAPIALDGTPVGSRWIFEVESARIDGERLHGTMKGTANADWFVLRPDGTGTLDVRALLETDDGALVFIQYLGRTDVAAGSSTIYTAPLFETGDERYTWLNQYQGVGIGSASAEGVDYEFYAVL